MPECEFKTFCDSIGYTYPCEKDEEEIAYCAVRITLNSPQFKKQYEEKIRKAIDDFREEVVEAVKTGYIPLTHVSIVENAKETICEIIRTHRKETE